MSEEAKAVQEVAKAAKELRPELQALGRFLAKALGRPTEQIGGLVGDLFAMARMEVAVRFSQRAERMLAERGLSQPTRQVALSVIFPLLSAASLEEDETLSDMFAALLVNAVDASCDIDITKSFVETVRLMSPFEARLLHQMAHAPAQSLNDSGFMLTAGLPGAYWAAPASDGKNPEDEVPRKTSLALASLTAFGCVQCASTWGGGTIQRQAKVTEYGAALIAACDPAPKETAAT